MTAAGEHGAGGAEFRRATHGVRFERFDSVHSAHHPDRTPRRRRRRFCRHGNDHRRGGSSTSSGQLCHFTRIMSSRSRTEMLTRVCAIQARTAASGPPAASASSRARNGAAEAACGWRLSPGVMTRGIACGAALAAPDSTTASPLRRSRAVGSCWPTAPPWEARRVRESVGRASTGEVAAHQQQNCGAAQAEGDHRRAHPASCTLCIVHVRSQRAACAVEVHQSRVSLQRDARERL